MANKIKDARQLLYTQNHGILSTHSLDFPELPFGSLVTYCLNAQGIPVLLISQIAEHTKNIQSNAYVSLAIMEKNEERVQQSVRLTYLAKAQKVSKEDIVNCERYFHFFPETRNYYEMLDFDFYELKPQGIRFIGGFAKASWIDAEDLNPRYHFSIKEENEWLEAIEQTQKSLVIQAYQALHKRTIAQDDNFFVLGLDCWGVDVSHQNRKMRIPFATSVTGWEGIMEQLNLFKNRQ